MVDDQGAYEELVYDKTQIITNRLKFISRRVETVEKTRSRTTSEVIHRQINWVIEAIDEDIREVDAFWR